MKTKPTIAAALATITLVLSPVASAQEREITLTGDPWPPYVIGEIGQEANEGIAVELVRRVFERIDGVVPRFPLIPWERALRAVELGTMDGIVILAKTEERERYMIYSEPLITARSLVWHSSDRFGDGFEWSSIDDMEPYVIGAVRGYDYGVAIDERSESGDLQLVQVDNVDQLFDMLAHGRVDLALANESVGYRLARLYEDQVAIKPSSRATGLDVYYMSLSRNSAAAEMMGRINEIVRELREEGVVDAITRGR